MDAPGRVGEHLQHVVFRPRIVVFGGENRLFVPLALPARLGFTGVVAFGGHGIAGLFVGIRPSRRRRTRPQKRLRGQRVGEQIGRRRGVRQGGHRCHTPRRRGIQYTVACRIYHGPPRLLDAPPAVIRPAEGRTGWRGMTVGRDMRPRSRGAMRPRFASPSALAREEGAGKAGCALHPRSRVQSAQRKRTRAYRFSGGNPAFPAQWFYDLLRALPGDRAFLPPSLCRCSIRKA